MTKKPAILETSVRQSNEKIKILPLKKSLDENVNLLKSFFADDETFTIRYIQNEELVGQRLGLIYLGGLINPYLLKQIITSLIKYDIKPDFPQKDLLRFIKDGLIPSDSIKTIGEAKEAASMLLKGKTVLLIDGISNALIISTQSLNYRKIDQPEDSSSVMGSKESFVESIIINTTLIRKRIRNTNLKFQFKTLGRMTKTRICICYMKNLILKDILTELEKRLETIDIDGILESNYIAELIKDHPISPYKTIGSYEKPDVVASKLMEGRAAILIDGCPFVLTLPFIHAEIIQSNDDYYHNYYYASFNRLLRILASFGSILLPALYLSIESFHQEILPTPLFLSILKARQGIALPSGVSLFITMALFDLLREASSRMPSNIKNLMSFIGTLVLGRILFEARIFCAPVVIISALSGIFLLINYASAGATIILRYLFVLATSLFGIYGMLFSFLTVVFYLISKRSFGVPYLLNLSRLRNHNYQDVYIRSPWWKMIKRPKIIGGKNHERLDTENRGNKTCGKE